MNFSAFFTFSILVVSSSSSVPPNSLYNKPAKYESSENLGIQLTVKQLKGNFCF